MDMEIIHIVSFHVLTSSLPPFSDQWWTKHYNVDGQVTQHLSPFEQNVMTPMFKTAFQNTLKRIKNFVIEAGPGLSFGIGVYVWGKLLSSATFYITNERRRTLLFFLIRGQIISCL